MLSSSGHIKISGLDFARILPHPSDRAYTICGSVGLVAPEVLRYNVGYGFPSDWWMVGILFYEVLHGEPPRAELIQDSTNVTKDAEETEPVGLSKDGCISHSAWDLLTRLLEPNPETRLTGTWKVNTDKHAAGSRGRALPAARIIGNKLGDKRTIKNTGTSAANEEDCIRKHRWFRFYQHKKLSWVSFRNLEQTPPFQEEQSQKYKSTCHSDPSSVLNNRNKFNNGHRRNLESTNNDRFGSTIVSAVQNGKEYGALPMLNPTHQKGQSSLLLLNNANKHTIGGELTQCAPRCGHHVSYPS